MVLGGFPRLAGGPWIPTGSAVGMEGVGGAGCVRLVAFPPAGL